jgi:hypothetical protein
MPKKGKAMDPSKRALVLEMYKAHFTASEAAAAIGYSYQSVIVMYREYAAMNIQKYDRFSLIPEEVLDHVNAA